MSIQVSPNVDPRFVGIPYKLGGKSFSGADCIGVVILWLKEQGLDYDYDERDALRMKKYWETSPGKFVDMVSEYGAMIAFPQVRKYDFLMFFSVDDSIFPTLPAVMVDDRFMLFSHKKESGSEVVMLSLEWKERFWGAIRLRKVDEKGLL